MNTIYHLPRPRSFADVEAWMGKKMSRKVAHNTQLTRAGDESFFLTYHDNLIVVYHPEQISVGHCGWATSTTADRFHHLTPFSARFTYSYYKGPDGKKAWHPGSAGDRENAKILVAGIELPDNGSAIALTWEGKLVSDSATA